MIVLVKFRNVLYLYYIEIDEIKWYFLEERIYGIIVLCKCDNNKNVTLL